jgi:hypothetical protein
MSTQGEQRAEENKGTREQENKKKLIRLFLRPKGTRLFFCLPAGRSAKAGQLDSRATLEICMSEQLA